MVTIILVVAIVALLSILGFGKEVRFTLPSKSIKLRIPEGVDPEKVTASFIGPDGKPIGDIPLTYKIEKAPPKQPIRPLLARKGKAGINISDFFRKWEEHQCKSVILQKNELLPGYSEDVRNALDGSIFIFKNSKGKIVLMQKTGSVFKCAISTEGWSFPGGTGAFAAFEKIIRVANLTQPAFLGFIAGGIKTEEEFANEFICWKEENI